MNKQSSAAAVALKRHCHSVIDALGARSPPEAFLFRGNAYFALGQPYFAVADYNTAAQVLQLSGRHQRRCYEALAHFPAHQVGTYPSDDSHLHLYVHPYLNGNCEVAKVDAAVGRGVVAKENILPCCVVVRGAEPWLRYPTDDGLCAFCTKPLPERFFTCKNPNCHEEYCSRDCRTMALSLYHSRSCGIEGLQALELDMYTQMKAAETSTAKNAAAAQLLMLRVLAVSLQQQVIPSALSELRILSGRLLFSPKVLSESFLEIYERFTRSCHTTTSISYEEMIGVLARVTANCFHRETCVELNLARSMLNHSCAANAAEDPTSGEVKTTRGVARGEEITINYYPQLKHLAFAERSTELERRGFVCRCPRCQREQRKGAEGRE
ncbi:SET and MYND domain-containing protein [Trypanosoma conorhini]|uniref:SET and MYND domain-containing protein n=1 Tax=Trypanosoma conorhini TaxID=83891 RepID=A0A422P094_9TRYP|nr:SET and MYND domain-containing protein [Trypanosoma conorhini]RNF11150.1 SET and MYND domain-containing protein [Trypanosoma conorhini]